MWHSNTCSICTCNIGINSWAALFDSPFNWSIWSFPQTLSHINLLCSMTKSCDRGCLTKLLKAQQHKSNIVPRLLNSSPNSLMDPTSAARGVWDTGGGEGGTWCSYGHVTKMAIVIKKLLSERRKGGLWCDWFLPQLQVGGALLEEHHVEQFRVPARPWLSQLTAHILKCSLGQDILIFLASLIEKQHHRITPKWCIRRLLYLSCFWAS